MDDEAAIQQLVSDLHWQIDQLRPRGIKNNAGHPYNPSYYKRGLDNALQRGGLAVVEYIRRYVYKPRSDGYKKLEDAHSLDLACEALVADETKPYARLSVTPIEPRRAHGSRPTSRRSRRATPSVELVSTRPEQSCARKADNAGRRSTLLCVQGETHSQQLVLGTHAIIEATSSAACRCTQRFACKTSCSLSSPADAPR